MITAKNGDKGLAFGNATLCSLPEIFCLWAAEQRDLTRSNIKHLVRRIRKGNWASLRIPQRSALRCID